MEGVVVHEAQRSGWSLRSVDQTTCFDESGWGQSKIFLGRLELECFKKADLVLTRKGV